MPRAERQRNYVFTINNPTPEEANGEVNLGTHVKWTVYQLEEGEAGTQHIQGVVAFQNAISLAGARAIHGRAHWEVCQNIPASIEYCQKEDTRVAGPWVVGTLPAGMFPLPLHLLPLPPGLPVPLSALTEAASTLSLTP